MLTSRRCNELWVSWQWWNILMPRLALMAERCLRSDVGRSVTMIIIQSLWLTCTHWCSLLLCIFNQVLLLSRTFKYNSRPQHSKDRLCLFLSFFGICGSSHILFCVLPSAWKSIRDTWLISLKMKAPLESFCTWAVVLQCGQHAY